jgi:hypothetical protein
MDNPKIKEEMMDVDEDFNYNTWGNKTSGTHPDSKLDLNDEADLETIDELISKQEVDNDKNWTNNE